MFQIVRCSLDNCGNVVTREALEPLFELWEDAVAMAEFDSSSLWGEYGYDDKRDCWWASDGSGRMYRFEIERARAIDAGLKPVTDLSWTSSKCQKI
jgi:hypothetical protein